MVGSLLRPAYLKEARARHAAGAIGDAELKRAEDHAVDDAVSLQTPADQEAKLALVSETAREVWGGS